LRPGISERSACSCVTRAEGGAALAIMCKVPRPGRSKTRLARAVGADHAAALAACFLRDVAAAIDTLPLHGAHGYGIYAPAGAEEELRRLLPASFRLMLQDGPDLGVALREGAGRLLDEQGHSCAVLINADSPTLPQGLLLRAAEALGRDGDRVVLAPATDGGYTLIGVKADHPELFHDIPWSTSDVFRLTVERADAIGLPVELLPLWYDIDDAETLGVLLDEMGGTSPTFAAPGIVGYQAPATRAYLAASGLTLVACA
jgi:rSAM/selenodomain-associated transferase 1